MVTKCDKIGASSAAGGENTVVTIQAARYHIISNHSTGCRTLTPIWSGVIPFFKYEVTIFSTEAASVRLRKEVPVSGERGYEETMRGMIKREGLYW